MATKRRLTDMYRIQSDPITFDDGSGDPITVIVRKLNPVDHQTALRHANAARSRAAALLNTPEDDEYQAQWSMILDYDVESLVRYLVEDHRMERSQVLESELADDEEWKKDDYLNGLQHDWMDALKDRYAMDPEDPEARRCFDELKRFSDKLDVLVQASVDDFEDDLNKRDIDYLRDAVFQKLMTTYSQVAWLQEYRRCEVYFGTRTEDGKERYFNHRDEVSECPPQIFSRLQEVYREIAVEVEEGKDSLETVDSSPSSEQPESLETESLSGQEDVSQ